MTLLEFLVKELPQRGGWPDGYDSISTNGYGAVWAYKTTRCAAGRELHFHSSIEGRVTREQYEAALAASQKVEWDGDGLPPVGLEVEIRYAGDEWKVCRLIAYGYEQIIFQYTNGREFSGHRNNYKFRPIRSEADKKRKETIDLMDKRFKEVLASGSTEAMAIFATMYDTILSGQIPSGPVE